MHKSIEFDGTGNVLVTKGPIPVGVPLGIWTDFVFCGSPADIARRLSEEFNRRNKVTRIYKVASVRMGGTATLDRLVRAGTPAQAVRHVTRGLFIATKATQDELVDLLSKGGKVEDAVVEEPEGG